MELSDRKPLLRAQINAYLEEQARGGGGSGACRLSPCLGACLPGVRVECPGWHRHNPASTLAPCPHSWLLLQEAEEGDAEASGGAGDEEEEGEDDEQ